MGIISALIFAILNTGCGLSQETSSDFVSEEVGILSELISEIELSVSKLPNIYSFILVKKGKLVSENYYNGADKNTLLHIRSITKSITSLLVGKLSDTDPRFSLEKKIIDFYSSPELSQRKDGFNEITIEHILDMQSGFQWNENLEAINWYTSVQNPTEYILSKDVVNKPGTEWNYNSGSVHLLEPLFEYYSGLGLENFAVNVLFKPLKIEEFSWDKDPQGNTRPDAGIAFKAKDLAKIGQLILSQGKINDEVVISDEWIREFSDDKIDLNSSYGLLENLHYNNLWWFGEYKQYNIVFGLGYGGQLLIIVPQLELILVSNHEYRLSPSIANTHSKAFIEVALIPLLENQE